MIELAIVIAVLVGIGQVIKQLGLPKKYLPAVNVILGVIAGLTMVEAPTVQEQVLYGIIAGLSASGLFDQSKLVKKK